MRLSKTHIGRYLWQDLLLWVVPLLLIIPNVWLDITERYTFLESLTNILLPGGLYLWLMGLSRNTGRTAVLMLPMYIYAAFQIVLLNLYGESIIAIDMFLNVVTTNVGEVSELLSNLIVAIITVCVIYLPLLTAGIILWSRRMLVRKEMASRARRYGLYLLGAGVISLAACYIKVPEFKIERRIFPVNVISNTISAGERTAQSNKYHETSAGFRFNATSTHPDSLRELYVLVIGETSRAENWQLYGYGRATNPRLSLRDSLLFFPKTLSQSNTTHKSVPLLLSHVDASEFGDSIYTSKSIITAFSEAGFRTAYLSNQSRNHSLIDFFAEEADSTLFLTDDGKHHHDHELLSALRHFISTAGPGKNFVILHSYGSHFCYNERYQDIDRHFTPDAPSAASKSNRPALINAYDNTIVATDRFLDDVIAELDKAGCPAALMYLSDHGEDIFDDSRGRFLHASPVPTSYQIHVPLLMWFSLSYTATFPGIYGIAAANAGRNVASNRVVFDTMLQIGGITTPYADRRRSLADSTYNEGPRLYLNDYNEAVPLVLSGLKDIDLMRIEANNISVN